MEGNNHAGVEGKASKSFRMEVAMIQVVNQIYEMSLLNKKNHDLPKKKQEHKDVEMSFDDYMALEGVGNDKRAVDC